MTIQTNNLSYSSITSEDIREIRRFKAFMQRLGYTEFSITVKGRTIRNY